MADFYLKSLVIIETSNICLQIQLKTREMSYLNVKGKGLSNQNYIHSEWLKQQNYHHGTSSKILSNITSKYFFVICSFDKYLNNSCDMSWNYFKNGGKTKVGHKTAIWKHFKYLIKNQKLLEYEYDIQNKKRCVMEKKKRNCNKKKPPNHFFWELMGKFVVRELRKSRKQKNENAKELKLK